MDMGGKFQVRGGKFVVTCTRALMSVARCIYGNCFVGKYFMVCFSTTKNTKILPPPPPEKYPLYGSKTIIISLSEIDW